MGTRTSELEFRHDNDCRWEGCPGHKMTALHQTTSDVFIVEIDGEHCYSGDDNTTRALLKLIREVDYPGNDLQDTDSDTKTKGNDKAKGSV